MDLSGKRISDYITYYILKGEKFVRLKVRLFEEEHSNAIMHTHGHKHVHTHICVCTELINIHVIIQLYNDF